MGNFASRWQRASSSNSSDNRGSGILRSSGSNEKNIKQRIEEANRHLQIQIAKLDQSTMKLRERDSSLFNKVVISVQQNENARANMFANELSEIRKMIGIVVQAKLALEQLVLRLSTVQEFGDIAVNLIPAVEAIRAIRPGLANLVPEAEHEIGEVSGLLSSILVDAGQVNPTQFTFNSVNEDADRVIAEAELVVEQKMKQSFPDVPTNTASDAGLEAA
jgi:division protein CdvB (Snf7/Vps24/ESCRT-III family)